MKPIIPFDEVAAKKNSNHVFQQFKDYYGKDFERQFDDGREAKLRQLQVWAKELAAYPYRDVVKACAQAIAECDYPPNLRKFLGYLRKELDDTDLEVLFREAMTCVRKKRYDEPHTWQSPAQQYAIIKCGYQNCIANEVKGFKAFKKHYAHGLELEAAGELQQYQQLTYLPEGSERKDWTEQQELNRVMINRLKSNLSQEGDDHQPDMRRKIWGETKKRYAEFGLLNEFFERYGRSPEMF